MKNKLLRLLPLIAIPLMVFNGTLSVSARSDHDHGSAQIVKVGKNVDLTFDKETGVGDLTLKPGHYVLQHRVNGTDHFIQFTEWSKGGNRFSARGVPKAHAGDVKCKLESLDKKVKQTAIFTAKEGDAQRIIKVVVAGENVEHVF